MAPSFEDAPFPEDRPEIIMPREECTDHCSTNSERFDGFCINCGNVCTPEDAPSE